MRVICKNTRGLKDTRIWEILNELTAIQWDILLLSETPAPDDDVLLTGGHRLLTSNGGDIYAGVAVMIHSRWCEHIINIGRISGRIMYVDIRIGTMIYRYIAAYVPHSDYTFQVFEEIINEMRGVLEDGRKLKYKCILGGDLNTQIGHGDRSNYLWDLFQELGMTITNLSDDSLPEEKWTFRSSLGILRQLDYVISDDSLQCESAGPVDYLDLGSDHRGFQQCIEYFSRYFYQGRGLPTRMWIGIDFSRILRICLRRISEAWRT